MLDPPADNVQFDLVFVDELPTGRWLRLLYRTTLYGSAGRPVIHFEGDEEEIRATMPAALFGTGEWVGLVPEGTRRIFISLPAACAAEGFSLTSSKVLSLVDLLLLARQRSAGKALVAAGLSVMGRKADASGLLKEIFGTTPLARYHEWRARGERSLDLAGLEARRDAWHQGPHVRVVVKADRKEPVERLTATLESLKRQSYAKWSLVLVDDVAKGVHDRQVLSVEGTGKAARLWEGLEASDIVLPILAGDTIPDYALAALVEFASNRPDLSLFYADEDSVTAGRRYVLPELKPDWSPIFHAARPYVGRAVYFRRRAVEGLADISSTEFLQPSTWNALFAREAGPVGHVRRVLLTKFWMAPVEIPPGPVAAPAVDPGERKAATLIILTRDRADLLAACLAGLEKTEPRTFDLLIVDNGSEQLAARELLDRVKAYPWVRVLDAAGPFNFSALCNRAAALAEGRVLVFLNNDTEAIRTDWVAHLVGWAMQPDVGAVGARLIYSSGRLQHAGLVLGLGGYAAHIDVGASPADEGYLGRLRIAHEVSAVTGACLAVEKCKFDAVGGFDEEKYPIELGDVDLCLRMARRGWRTMFTPDALLIHHESATRGKVDVAGRHTWEKRHFLSDWKDVVADDPCFHPALSLTALHTSLDH